MHTKQTHSVTALTLSRIAACSVFCPPKPLKVLPPTLHSPARLTVLTSLSPPAFAEGERERERGKDGERERERGREGKREKGKEKEGERERERERGRGIFLSLPRPLLHTHARKNTAGLRDYCHWCHCDYPIPIPQVQYEYETSDHVHLHVYERTLESPYSFSIPAQVGQRWSARAVWPAKGGVARLRSLQVLNSLSSCSCFPQRRLPWRAVLRSAVCM